MKKTSKFVSEVKMFTYQKMAILVCLLLLVVLQVILIYQVMYYILLTHNINVSDDHDVNHFLTYSLYPPGTTFKPVGTAPHTSDEEQKLTKEYADYQRKLDREKEE